MEQKNKKLDLPFEGPYKTKPSAVPGKHGIGFSTARHLARQGMAQQVKKAKTNEDNEQDVVEGSTSQQKAHEYNLDAAQKEMDSRHAEGEDMTGAKIDKKTYQIVKPKKPKVNEAEMDPREYDYEGDMAKSQLKSIIINAQQAHDMLEDDTNMAEWVQSKITLAADYISTVADYMAAEMKEEVEPIDEISKATLGSYIKKAAQNATNNRKIGADFEHQAKRAISPGMKAATTVLATRFNSKSWKRRDNVNKAVDRLTAEETVVETKGAPKGYHFTKAGQLKRGDADQDGNGGPMLRSDPLDKQRNKIPAVSENTFKSFRNQIAEKHLTPAEMKKREEVAKAIHKENPGMPMGNKMAIATASAKKAA